MKRIPCVFALMFLFASVGFGRAASFPEPSDPYINDFAGVVSIGEAASIRQHLEILYRDTGIEVVLVTIHSLSDYGATDFRSYATALFNKWGVGDKSKNNGILILFSMGDREVRVEMGAGYGNRYDSALQEVVDTKMLPCFRNGEYSWGLHEGVMGIVGVVARRVSWFGLYKWHLLVGGALAIACICAGASCMKQGKKGWGYTFFAIAGMIILFLISLILRKGGRRSGFGGGRSGGGGAGGSW